MPISLIELNKGMLNYILCLSTIVAKVLFAYN